ncbi:MAG: BTAD domain-containing putative transcriptional regulator [Anaerolineae bacterium]
MKKVIKLLGNLEITTNGRSSPLMKSAQGCALITYLLLTKQSQNREVLADLLWDAESTAESLLKLRKLLYRIRPHMPELEATRQHISFKHNEADEIDLHILESALKGSDISQLDEGLALYKNELLSGFYLEQSPIFNEWLTVERENMRRAVWDGYRRLCTAYHDQQAWQLGGSAAERWLALDPLDEEVMRERLKFLIANGQVNTAADFYTACQQLLQDELGTDPEPATAKLGERVAVLQAKVKEKVDWQSAENKASQSWPEPKILPEPTDTLPSQTYLPYHRNPTFVGREPELLTLADHLLPNSDSTVKPAMVVSGMGGLGKTQLAVEFAYRHGRHFPGGVYWISFAEAENVRAEVALVGSEHGMKLYKESEELTLTEQVGRVKSEWQKPVPRLLIFDNCEGVQLALDWLPVIGGCSVLLTSRRGTWPVEVPIKPLPLITLPRKDSVLLLQQAADHISADDAALVAAEVGDLPLALHLAGQFLARLKQITPQNYVAQLRSKPLMGHVSLLGKVSRFSPTGHDLNVARTFALSFDQLSFDNETDVLARQLLARITHLALGEPIPQAFLLASLADDSSEDSEELLAGEVDILALLAAEDSLHRLLDLGLVRQDDSETVSMHRLIGAYTRETLAEDTLSQGMAQAAIEKAMVKLLSPKLESPKTLGLLSIPTVHLKQVTEFSLLRKSRYGALLALALGRHFTEDGESESAIEVLHRGRSLAQSQGDRYAEARIIMAIAVLEERLGQIDELIDNIQQAEQLLYLLEEPNKRWLSYCLRWRTWGHYRFGQLEEAYAAGIAAHELATEINDKELQADSLSMLGNIKTEPFGGIERSTTHIKEALQLYIELGNDYSTATCQSNLGNNAFFLGDYENALYWFQQSLITIRRVGHKLHTIVFLIDSCLMHSLLGNYQSTVTELLEIKDEVPEKWFLTSYFFSTLASGFLGLGQLEDALFYAQKGVASAQAITDPKESGWAWYTIACVAAKLGRPVSILANGKVDESTSYSAQACFEQSLAKMDEIKAASQRAIVLCAFAEFEEQQRNLKQCEAMRSEAREIFTEMKLPLMLSRFGLEKN